MSEKKPNRFNREQKPTAKEELINEFLPESIKSLKNTGEQLRAKYDPSAKYDYTSVTVRLNQYEYELFKAASTKDDRKLLDWMRRVLVKAGEAKLSE